MNSSTAAAGQAATDVTVVVTSFNHQAYIEQGLDSVAAQGRPVRQVIVIDDCSRDDTADVIEHWLSTTEQPFTFIRHQRNLGVCASLNEALALAEGKYFCHVSGDDWEELDRFARQVAAIERADAGTSLVVGDIREVDAGGGLIVEHNFGKRLGHMTGAGEQAGLLARLLAENVIPAPGVLMRTEALRTAGGYDETLAFEDYDMWLRLALSSPIAYEPGVVANYRVLDTSLTRNTGRRVSVLRSEADMLAKHIGSSAENDAIIGPRLVTIAGEILSLGAADELRHVLEQAASATPEPWLRVAVTTLRRPGGLKRLEKNLPAELVPRPKSAA